MHFTTPLLKGKFVKRYKRFFADIILEDGTPITAHCPNTGSMKGLLLEGATAWVTPNDDPKRKLKYTLELLETLKGDKIGVNTQRPNHIVAEAILAKKIPELAHEATLKQEVKYGTNSRIDILLTAPKTQQKTYVEVKNTTLREDINGVPTAQFPDAVTTRGTKHLNELATMVKEGHRAVMLFLCHREDCTQFTPAAEIDPTYAQTLKTVATQGVEVLCYACKVTEKDVTLSHKLPIIL